MKKGNVEIVLQEKEQRILYCSRIGGMENGSFVLEEDFIESGVDLNSLDTAEQLEKAAARIQAYVKSGFMIQTNEEGIARIEDLEEGVYLLNSPKTEVQGSEKILPTLLYLPSWDVEEEKMLYDVTLLPKYGVDPPNTGDSTELAAWSIFWALSAIFLACKFKKTLKKEKCF